MCDIWWPNSCNLFILNRISHEERLGNLLVLLSDEDVVCGSVADLTTNAVALKILKNCTIETTPNNPPEIHFSVNDSCAVVWYLGAKWKRFLGYIKEKVEGENYLMEHLERVKTNHGMLWKYPDTDDVTSVSVEQIVHVDVKEDWILNWNARQITFELHNATEIINGFAIFIENYP